MFVPVCERASLSSACNGLYQLQQKISESREGLVATGSLQLGTEDLHTQVLVDVEVLSGIAKNDQSENSKLWNR